jgi:hypothetical protein
VGRVVFSSLQIRLKEAQGSILFTTRCNQVSPYSRASALMAAFPPCVCISEEKNYVTLE